MNLFLFSIFAQSFFNPYYFGSEKTNFLTIKDYIFFSNKTKVFFSLNNYFTLGIEKGAKRMLFNFQPEEFYFFIPFLKTYQIGLKVNEYLNQEYDIYYQPENFKDENWFWHVKSNGGIYNLGLIFTKSWDKLLLFSEGNYNFGNNMEIFAVKKEKDVLTAETLFYDYWGRNFRSGFILKIKNFYLDFQAGFLKKINKKINNSVATYSLKPNFSFSLITYFKENFRLAFAYNYQNDPLIFVEKNVIFFLADLWFLNRFHTISFGFSPKGVKEIDFKYLPKIIIKNYGCFYPELGLSYRYGCKQNLNLRELVFILKFNIFFEELWQKRIRKWGS